MTKYKTSFKDSIRDQFVLVILDLYGKECFTCQYLFKYQYYNIQICTSTLKILQYDYKNHVATLNITSTLHNIAT